MNLRYNLTMNESIHNDIERLPPEQQLEIAEFIYSSLASKGHLLTQEQMNETKRRAEQVKREPDSTLTRDQMWQAVENLRNARKN